MIILISSDIMMMKLVWARNGLARKVGLLSGQCVEVLPLLLFRLVWWELRSLHGGGGWMVVFGLLCVVFCFLYTTHLSYIAMGDVLVLLFFGIVPVTLTYYLEMPAGSQPVTWEVFIAALACGIVIDALLVVNNYRDLAGDRRAGKRTLAVVLGPALTRRLYSYLGVAAYLMSFVFMAVDSLWGALLPLIYLLLHLKTYRKMVRINEGYALNGILGETARNIFIYGLLVSIGLLL